MLALDGLRLPHEHRHEHYPIDFKNGFGPYAVSNLDPSFKVCLRNFGPSEFAVWGITTVIPCIVAFRNVSTK